MSQPEQVFQQNGFEFSEGLCGDRPGCQLCLTAVPISKNVIFGPADVQEMVAMLDGGAVGGPNAGSGGWVQGPLGMLDGGIIRPTRVRSMLAMRACRGSIMIGKALDAPRVRARL